MNVTDERPVPWTYHVEALVEEKILHAIPIVSWVRENRRGCQVETQIAWTNKPLVSSCHATVSQPSLAWRSSSSGRGKLDPATERCLWNARGIIFQPGFRCREILGRDQFWFLAQDAQDNYSVIIRWYSRCRLKAKSTEPSTPWSGGPWCYLHKRLSLGRQRYAEARWWNPTK